MNAMGRQLEQLIERHRSFVGDASHQLRTPLTSLRLRLENLEAAAIDATSRVEIEAAIEETIRLSNLVGDLLKLARNDGPPSLTAVDLGSLADDRVNTWQAMAEHDVELLLNRPKGKVEAIAVAGAVEQVLDNLLDNALHVAPPRSRILVSVERGHMHHRLVVTDEGPGPSDEEKARATDRFWRADHGRPGTGLGLAVVASLIEASGGTLIFDDNPHGRGLRVTTGWPTLFPSDGRLTEPRSSDTVYRNTVEWSPPDADWDEAEVNVAKSRRWGRTRRTAETR
jgi:signal transduction histidine kinase